MALVAQLDGHLTSDQEVVGSIPANILSWRVIMKYFLYVHSFPSADSRRAVVSFW